MTFLLADAAAAGLMAFSFFYGRRRGFISMIWKAAAWIAAAVLAVLLTAPEADAVRRAEAGIALFILIRLILSVLYRVLDAASKLPVINCANRLIGAILGLINFMFIFYIVLAAVSLMPEYTHGAAELINGTYLVKYFYNNNILLYLLK